jgi:hypothetical protein
MSEFLEDTSDRMPNQYSTPGFWPTVPGADWFIEGRRYREVGRETTANGYTLTIEEKL